MRKTWKRSKYLLTDAQTNMRYPRRKVDRPSLALTVANAVASLRMVTPGAEFRGVTLHRLYFKECIVGNVY